MSAMPVVGGKFTSFKSFAVASLEEIYTATCLADARRFEANTLESGFLINDGSGRFAFRPLPRLAQAAPAFGVELTDVDGDGNLDVFLVQNFFSPQPETGRMDGGVGMMLSGNGDGTFDPVWPDHSGLVVAGDAKALTRTDLNGDGWVDFVVSINDGAVVAFENRGSTENRVLVVKLRGDAGNPTAVGAWVTLHREDGTRQVAEVYAGGGYLSQSTSVLVFGLGSAGKAKRVDVRWPDGTRTSHRPSESSMMTIDAPTWK